MFLGSACPALWAHFGLLLSVFNQRHLLGLGHQLSLSVAIIYRFVEVLLWLLRSLIKHNEGLVVMKMMSQAAVSSSGSRHCSSCALSAEVWGGERVAHLLCDLLGRPPLHVEIRRLTSLAQQDHFPPNKPPLDSKENIWEKKKNVSGSV